MPSVWLYNRTGSTINAGRVVAVDTLNNLSFKAPSSWTDPTMCGVTVTSIPNAASGAVAITGPAYVYMPSGSTTGHYLHPDAATPTLGYSRSGLPIRAMGMIISGAGVGQNALALLSSRGAGIANIATTSPATGANAQDMWNSTTDRYQVFQDNSWNTVSSGGKELGNLNLFTEVYFFDDFFGDALQDHWNPTATVGGVAPTIITGTTTHRGGVAEFATAPAAGYASGSTSGLNWGAHSSFAVGGLPQIEARAKFEAVGASGKTAQWMGLTNSAGDIWVTIRATDYQADPAKPEIWITDSIGTIVTGAGTAFPSLDTNYHTWKIQFTATGAVSVSQDSTLFASITGLNFGAVTFSPRVNIVNEVADGQRKMYVDFIKMIGNR